MHKIKAFREIAVATIPIFFLTACADQRWNKTIVTHDDHSIFVDDNGEVLETLDINGLRNIGVYVVFDKLDNGSITYHTEFLTYHKYDEYTVYTDAMTGNIYSIQINNPTYADEIVYGSTNHKDMYYVENLASEIYDFKEGGYPTSDNINLENETVDPFTVKLCYADYMAHNYRLVKSCYNSYINK